ncbi:cyclase family protein [Nocardia donostiensis]|uniref:Cyclase n=1 Tax=Nocardia donostiensis TaxID=1538463 RepID=A0A1W0B130_9NOCA|nr:cyclase family protein [Nocardia donostiensis]ONM46758.1 cyclase [Nocardia donostiensis]OQS16232.1 cyclase [Nocardia donostiensis]OQS19622.1 cyclase [Nocardia donostiensis]
MNAPIGSVRGDALIHALSMPRAGRIYDLSTGWWRHMPNFEGYPRFEVVTYNSPSGQRVDGRFPFDDPETNAVEFGYVSELVSGSLHTGTHIDALCHVTKGPNDEWHGGISATDAVGDYGARRGDAAALEPIVCRGVLLDIPGLLGLDALPPGFAVGAEHLARAARRSDVEIGPGDAVLVRTGQMRFWPDVERIRRESGGSGVDVDGARWLAEHGVRYVGADTQSFEVRPSSVAGNPLPVHLFLLQERGIHIMEWVDCEELAAEAVTSFLFVALPLSIRGGTGSPIRPIAIV